MISNRIPPIIIGMLLTFAMVIAPFSNPLSRDSYFILGYFSVILSFYFVFFKKRSFNNKPVLFIAVSFLLFGLSRVIWSFLMNQNGMDIYRLYSPTSSRIIIGAFIFFVIIFFKNEIGRFFNNTYVSSVIKILPLYILLYALYDVFFLEKPRVEFDTNRATAAAYLVSAIFFISLYFCSLVRNKFNVTLFFVNFIVSNVVIFLTQTRAAIAIYLILSVSYTAILFKDKLNFERICVIVFLAIVFTGLSYQFFYKDRVNEAVRETQHYDITKPGGSLGDRYTMWYAGLISLKHAPLGQSVESRNDFISEKIAEGKISNSIEAYINVHLHNELIDVLSLQGIIGGLLLLFIYLSLLYAAVKNKNMLLLMITLCLGGYGLTDVLFFSRESITVYLLCIAVSLVVGDKRETDKPVTA